MRIFTLMINRKLEPSLMTLAIPKLLLCNGFAPRTCVYCFICVCLWSWGGGGESTTLRDSDLRCILWSCVLVVTVDNWSVPLISAPCLSTAETINLLSVCRESTKCSQAIFRGFEAHVTIALKRNFPGSQINSPAFIWLLNLCWSKFAKTPINVNTAKATKEAESR